MLRLAIVLALVLSAFAHRAVPGSPLPDPAGISQAELAAYTLPDGSQPSICVSGASGSDDASVVSGCEYCRLASSILLPEPPAQALALQVAQNDSVQPDTGRLAFAPGWFPAAPITGPPFPFA
ncbi:MAG: hypothetical protein WBO55_09605 [Rhizobiaceae bacterium]